ncbi:MAG TPA: hypothetical protein VFY93_05600 [Planctomycetota bacterium]|nr:hypothetical protein [Planctomycetota bacterium]
MTGEPPIVRALRSLLAFLGRERIDYMLMGGMAIRTLAIPRPTYDIDLQVAAGEAGAKAFARQAQQEGYSVDEPHLRGFVDHLQGLAKLAMSIPAGDRWIPVDVFLCGSEYQREAFARRRKHDTDLGPLWLISPEDLVLHKLISNRPRDRADIADLLLVAGPFDDAYLREWANRLGIADRLEQVRGTP